jgi:hypothetical protein
MKNLILLTIILLIVPFCRAEKIKFFLTWSVKAENKHEGEMMDLFCSSFEGEFNKSMDEYIPCATYTSYANIVAALNNEREKQLLGVGDDNALKELAGSMGAQYLVSLKMIQLGQKVWMNAVCMHMTSAKTMVNVMLSAPLSEDAFDAVKELTSKFFDELLKYEVCPYKGKIKIEVQSDLDKDESKEYAVYCNGQDRNNKMRIKESKHSVNYWTFEKVTRVRANAFIDYHLSEEMEQEIEDGCYDCPSGKTRRYYKETNSVKGEIDEVSQESELEGKRIDDARTELTFNDDGTYYLKVDAASKETEFMETRYKYAESWCDNNNKPPETIRNKRDIPLKYVFGPYEGTAKDESLIQHPDPIVVTDPVSGEKTTYTISFDLLRE